MIKLNSEDIIEFTATGTIDGFGNQLSKYVSIDNNMIGFREDK
jgi:hypothetical protein